MNLSTHVLDTVLGQPAAGISVRLEAASPDGGWMPLVSTRTDRDGRAREDFTAPAGRALHAGDYRLVFDTAGYFADQGVKDFFYPEVAVAFTVADPDAHHHVPLLLSPYGYSTYRGT
ncbi:MAG: hydroxyisourate hydrolase [Actinocrinis sp.]